MESADKGSFPDVPVYPWFLKGWTTILAIFAVFLVLAGSTAFLLYQHHQGALRKHLEEDRSTARLLSILFDEHFDKIRTTMESYVSRPLLVQAAKEKSVRKALKHLEDLRRTNPTIEILVMSDEHGTLWTSSPLRPQVHGMGFAHRDWYRGVSSDWKPYVSNVVLRTIGEKDAAVHIAVPMRDEKGAVIAILVNTQRTVTLQRFVEQLPFGSDASISIVDRGGHIAYSTRYAFKKEVVPYPFPSVLKAIEPGKAGSFTVSEAYPGGGKRYVSFATIKGMDWRVFVSRSARSVILGEWRDYLQTSLITTLLFLVIGMSLVYLRKQVIDRQAMDRLLAERRLRESETRYTELFSTMTSGVAVYRATEDGEGFVVLDLNGAALRITGVGTDSIGKAICEVFPGVKEMGLFSVLQRVWRTGRTEFHPSSLYSSGRLSFWAENRVYRLPSGDVVAVFDDISERKRAEEELRRSEERFRSTLDNMLEGCQIIGSDWRYIYINDSADIHNRRPKEELLGKRYMDMWPGIEDTEVFRLIRQCMEERVTKHMECEFLFPDGVTGWFDLSIQPVPEGVFILSIDITERRRAEDSLKRHADRLQNLHRIDQDILMTIESTDTIVQTALIHLQRLLDCREVSAAVFTPDGTEMMIFSTGLTGERITRPTSDMTPDERESLKIFRQGKMEVVDDTSGIASPSKMAKMFQSGDVRSFISAPLVSAREIYGALVMGWEEPRAVSAEETEIAGEVAGQVAIAIEQARLLQETRQQAADLEDRVGQRTAQLEAANRELEAFAYSVSHDLRAPLRHISGYADLLMRRCHDSLPETGGHYLDTITDSARQMGVLIDDLLQFSRTGRQEMCLADLDMNGVVQEVVESIKADIGGRDIEWDVAGLPRVHGDHSMLRLVWLNLVGNAVKFTRPREKARIEIGFREEDGEYVFFVRDNGVGFDMQYAGKLFGVFQRLHSPEDFEGTGIGLANVYRIIARHEGRVWAEAEPGKGATFCFALPKNEEEK
jgi:PAS domain S-box-containing protein